ncbi:hypothetical protein STVIR_1921 [Streptomyces viridochromogenes Tue57]|uniref:Uncharacterized protein n=1 Tax=Streptomyces viridochromogenes Tue57 TaxID=1160705 RepID=L8PHM9_STRVR|nr:hypothetical protein STVIR_1921 [Streptomyces viridochromogenes Tue57]
MGHCRSSALCTRSHRPPGERAPSCTLPRAHRLRTEGDAVVTVHVDL